MTLGVAMSQAELTTRLDEVEDDDDDSKYVSKRTSPLYSFLALDSCPDGADCVTPGRWPYLAGSEGFWNKAEGDSAEGGVGPVGGLRRNWRSELLREKEGGGEEQVEQTAKGERERKRGLLMESRW